jgi:hypothetical protein
MYDTTLEGPKLLLSIQILLLEIIEVNFLRVKQGNPIELQVSK